jgi:hypothetical protein
MSDVLLRTTKPIAAGTLASLVLAACGGGPYLLECGQGVDRRDCEEVAAFGYEIAAVEAERVHVEARSCTRYFDPPPEGVRCWSVRVLTPNDRLTVAVARQPDGTLIEATDLFPVDPGG